MPIPRKLVELVLARDNYRCVINGPHCTGEATVADHRANRGMGGGPVLNTAACLIGACRLDNGWKEDATGYQLEQMFARGLRVLKAATNALTAARCRETPVLYPDGQLYRLDDDGTRTPVTRTREEVAS